MHLIIYSCYSCLSLYLSLSLDYKIKETVERGKDLVLELHTPQARQVVFQSGRPAQWEVLWKKGQEPHPSLSHRIREEEGRVVFRNAGSDDEGTYRVLDEHGLALSTVKVTVTGEKCPGIHL